MIARLTVMSALIAGLILSAGPVGVISASNSMDEAVNAKWDAKYWNLPNPHKRLNSAPQIPDRQPDHTSSLVKVDFRLRNRSPHPGAVNRDRFVAQFTKEVSLSGGEYSMTTRSDDGVRLRVNGQTVIDQWNDHRVTSHSVSLDLPAGNSLIEIDYYENGGTSVIQFDMEKTKDLVEKVSPVITTHSDVTPRTVEDGYVFTAGMYHTIDCPTGCNLPVYQADGLELYLSALNVATGEVPVSYDAVTLGDHAPFTSLSPYAPVQFSIDFDDLPAGTYDIYVTSAHSNGSKASQRFAGLTKAAEPSPAVPQIQFRASDGQQVDENFVLKTAVYHTNEFGVYKHDGLEVYATVYDEQGAVVYSALGVSPESNPEMFNQDTLGPEWPLEFLIPFAEFADGTYDIHIGLSHEDGGTASSTLNGIVKVHSHFPLHIDY